MAVHGKRRIVMLGTSPHTRGGIAAVLNSYTAAGLTERWPLVHLPTHQDGNARQKALTAATALGRFVGLLLRRRVLLVHVHSASNASFWRKSVFIALAYVARRPILFHLHGGGFIDFFERSPPPRQRAIRFVLDRVSHIIVLTEEWRRRLVRVTINPNVSVIANPVNAQPLLAIDRRRHPENVVLFLGRFDRDKGIYDLIDAVAVLANEFPLLRLRFVGDGETAPLQRYAVDKGVGDRIELCGWVSGDAKVAVLAEASIWALPSYIEGMPMGLLEAMAAGLPVVASRVGGIPEVVDDGVQGLLIQPGDVEGLTRALRQLLHDPLRRGRMGQAARLRIRQRYAADIVLPQVEVLYRELTNPLKDIRNATPALGDTRRE